MATSAAATIRPRPSKASGRPTDMTRLASICASSIARIGSRSGSNQFVTQVVYAQASHTMTRSSRVCSAPSTVGRSIRWWDSWVIANTYTRSKNSSTFVTPGTPAEVMAVVKADAYGHGSVPAARAALAGGATWLGVAFVDEALTLRVAGITAPVLAWLWT